MIQIRSIVAASDLSAPARRAVDRAAAIARSSSASLTLVHAFSGSALDELRRWLDTNGAAAAQSIHDEVRERLRELAREVAAHHGIEVYNCTLSGHPVDEIIRLARKRKADLLVIGTLGAGFLRNRLVGSTAERVVKRSSRPVLMVRQAPRAPYRRVLVPVDFSPWSAPALEVAMAVAPDAHFVLLHAVAVPFESKLGIAGVDAQAVAAYRAAAREGALRDIRELALRAGLGDGRWTALVADDGDPWLAIIRLEQEQDCDLVVVGKHGRGAVEELLLGGTTHRVIAESSADVLVCTRGEAG